jgi:hypothetical protein
MLVGIIKFLIVYDVIDWTSDETPGQPGQSEVGKSSSLLAASRWAIL